MLSRLEHHLSRNTFPRLGVASILALCGLLGFVASLGLRELGLLAMGPRYVLAFAAAYLAFLVLIRLWASRWSEIVGELPLGDGAPTGGAGPVELEGGGGEFGGAGASGSWESAASADVPAAGGGGDLGGLDADEGAFVLVPIAVLVAVVLVLGSVVWAAPVILAEVVLDVALAAGAYRRVARREPRYWMSGVFRRTRLAALVAATLLGGLGFGLQALAPEATTIGRALETIAGS